MTNRSARMPMSRCRTPGSRERGAYCYVDDAATSTGGVNAGRRDAYHRDAVPLCRQPSGRLRATSLHASRDFHDSSKRSNRPPGRDISVCHRARFQRERDERAAQFSLYVFGSWRTIKNISICERSTYRYIALDIVTLGKL